MTNEQLLAAPGKILHFPTVLGSVVPVYRVDGVPNGVGGTVDSVCDPTGGFSFTQNSINNFGKINIMRGRRIIEFALRYTF